jgi:hypothetical protein
MTKAIQGQMSVAQTLHWLHTDRIADYIEDLGEQAANAATSGHPRRAGYLEHITGRFPEMVARAEAKAGEKRSLTHA